MVFDKISEAANQLEDIALIAKLMVIDLREGADNPYARVYWLRKELSYVVAYLGVGTPTQKDLQKIETEYEKQLPPPIPSK